jgi:hypothetical protein
MSLDGQSACPFRLGSGSPCFHKDCINPQPNAGQTNACLLVTNTYCETETLKLKKTSSYVIDTACSPGMVIDAVCDYKVSAASNALYSPPCSDVACASNPNTQACRTVVIDHCKTAAGKLDPGTTSSKLFFYFFNFFFVSDFSDNFFFIFFIFLLFLTKKFLFFFRLQF